MKPHRNFRPHKKEQAFAIVAFRYDRLQSDHVQRKEPESIGANVKHWLERPSGEGADIIGIRRVYLYFGDAGSQLCQSPATSARSLETTRSH